MSSWQMKRGSTRGSTDKTKQESLDVLPSYKRQFRLGSFLGRSSRGSTAPGSDQEPAKKAVLVLGGTGLVGGAVVRGLLTYPWFCVKVATRRPWCPEAALLKQAGALIVEVDFNYKHSLVVAMQGVKAVFFHSIYWENYSSTMEIAQGRNVVEAAWEAGVEHLVYDGTNYIKPPEGRVCAFLRSRMEIEEVIKTSGISYTIVVLPFYYEHLLTVFRPFELHPDFFALILPMESSLLSCACLHDMAFCICKIIQQGFPYYMEKVCLGAEMLSVQQMINNFNDCLRGLTFIDPELTADDFNEFDFVGAKDIAAMFAFYQNCEKIPDFSLTQALNPHTRTMVQWIEDNEEQIYAVLDSEEYLEHAGFKKPLHLRQKATKASSWASPSGSEEEKEEDVYTVLPMRRSPSRVASRGYGPSSANLSNNSDDQSSDRDGAQQQWLRRNVYRDRAASANVSNNSDDQSSDKDHNRDSQRPSSSSPNTQRLSLADREATDDDDEEGWVNRHSGRFTPYRKHALTYSGASETGKSVKGKGKERRLVTKRKTRRRAEDTVRPPSLVSLGQAGRARDRPGSLRWGSRRGVGVEADEPDGRGSISQLTDDPALRAEEGRKKAIVYTTASDFMVHNDFRDHRRKRAAGKKSVKRKAPVHRVKPAQTIYDLVSSIFSLSSTRHRHSKKATGDKQSDSPSLQSLLEMRAMQSPTPEEQAEAIRRSKASRKSRRMLAKKPFLKWRRKANLEIDEEDEEEENEDGLLPELPEQAEPPDDLRETSSTASAGAGGGLAKKKISVTLTPPPPPASQPVPSTSAAGEEQPEEIPVVMDLYETVKEARRRSTMCQPEPEPETEKERRGSVQSTLSADLESERRRKTSVLSTEEFPTGRRRSSVLSADYKPGRRGSVGSTEQMPDRRRSSDFSEDQTRRRSLISAEQESKGSVLSVGQERKDSLYSTDQGPQDSLISTDQERRDSLISAQPEDKSTGSIVSAEPEEKKKGSIFSAEPEVKSRGSILSVDPEVKSGGSAFSPELEEKRRGSIISAEPGDKSRDSIFSAEPDVKSRGSIFSAEAEVKSRGSIFSAEPEVKSRGSIFSAEPEVKSRGSIFSADPEVKSGGSTFSPEIDFRSRGSIFSAAPDQKEEGYDSPMIQVPEIKDTLYKPKEDPTSGKSKTAEIRTTEKAENGSKLKSSIFKMQQRKPKSAKFADQVRGTADHATKSAEREREKRYPTPTSPGKTQPQPPLSRTDTELAPTADSGRPMDKSQPEPAPGRPPSKADYEPERSSSLSVESAPGQESADSHDSGGQPKKLHRQVRGSRPRPQRVEQLANRSNNGTSHGSPHGGVAALSAQSQHGPEDSGAKASSRPVDTAHGSGLAAKRHATDDQGGVRDDSSELPDRAPYVEEPKPLPSPASAFRAAREPPASGKGWVADVVRGRVAYGRGAGRGGGRLRVPERHRQRMGEGQFQRMPRRYVEDWGEEKSQRVPESYGVEQFQRVPERYREEQFQRVPERYREEQFERVPQRYTEEQFQQVLERYGEEQFQQVLERYGEEQFERVSERYRKEQLERVPERRGEEEFLRVLENREARRHLVLQPEEAALGVKLQPGQVERTRVVRYEQVESRLTPGHRDTPSTSTVTRVRAARASHLTYTRYGHVRSWREETSATTTTATTSSSSQSSSESTTQGAGGDSTTSSDSYTCRESSTVQPSEPPTGSYTPSESPTSTSSSAGSVWNSSASDDTVTLVPSSHAQHPDPRGAIREGVRLEDDDGDDDASDADEEDDYEDGDYFEGFSEPPAAGTTLVLSQRADACRACVAMGESESMEEDLDDLLEGLSGLPLGPGNLRACPDCRGVTGSMTEVSAWTSSSTSYASILFSDDERRPGNGVRDRYAN